MKEIFKAWQSQAHSVRLVRGTVCHLGQADTGYGFLKSHDGQLGWKDIFFHRNNGRKFSFDRTVGCVGFSEQAEDRLPKESDVLIFNLDQGKSGKMMASPWGFLADYNWLLSACPLPPVQRFPWLDDNYEFADMGLTIVDDVIDLQKEYAQPGVKQLSVYPLSLPAGQLREVARSLMFKHNCPQAEVVTYDEYSYEVELNSNSRERERLRRKEIPYYSERCPTGPDDEVSIVGAHLFTEDDVNIIVLPEATSIRPEKLTVYQVMRSTSALSG